MAKTGGIIAKVNKHFENPLDRTIENVSKYLGISKRKVVHMYHMCNYQNSLIDFKGSSYVTKESKWVYNFIKSRNPEINVELSKRSKDKDKNEIYYQVFIKEKNLVILIDYNLETSKVPYNIIKLNKDDFRDIFELTRIKLLLIKKLALNKQIMLNRTIDILDYIEKHKNIPKYVFENELYLKMLGKAMEKTKKRLEKKSNKILDIEKQENYKHDELLLKTIRKDIDLSQTTLCNLLLYYNKDEEAYTWLTKRRRKNMYKNQD